MREALVKCGSDGPSLWLPECASLLAYACVSMRITTARRRKRRQKMNMLYGSSKILHGPSAREEPRAECLRLPNIINYLRAFTAAVFGRPRPPLRSATGFGVARLLMNTNYTFVSLLLNVSLLFSARWSQECRRLILCGGWCFGMRACPAFRFKVNAVHTEEQTSVFGELCTGEKLKKTLNEHS